MTQPHEPSATVARRQPGWILPGVAAALFAALTWPTWRWLWQEWMANDYYSHGVLIAPVALYLAWRSVRNQPALHESRPSAAPWGVGFLAASLGVYLLLLNGKAYYLAAFAMIAVLAGLVWTFGGLRLLRTLAFPIGYLALMVPLPFIERITLPLALFTGVCSSALVKFLGLDITVTGNAITLPNANLVVGAQCSGVNSMMALLALTSLCAYVLRGPLWGRLLLVALSIPLAMLGNILRVSNLLFVARYYGAEAAFRFYHDYSGIVFFVVVLALLIPLSHAVRCRTFRWEVL